MRLSAANAASRNLSGRIATKHRSVTGRVDRFLLFPRTSMRAQRLSLLAVFMRFAMAENARSNTSEESL
ncbi:MULTISPECIES: hypothetical protein [Ochrobactrum]|uniref:Uncharacterized protein n=1 Tax=Ochrobactrum chromiisoli TaxID=2993941 RepID=A0ABT3QUP7_9HYPH|nr:hypothetical protein [Ochrobactrum chromiisoli]MCX2699215.1 hypothetical protein [Ochrobactrum chromiisoli]